MPLAFRFRWFQNVKQSRYLIGHALRGQRQLGSKLKLFELEVQCQGGESELSIKPNARLGFNTQLHRQTSATPTQEANLGNAM